MSQAKEQNSSIDFSFLDENETPSVQETSDNGKIDFSFLDEQKSADPAAIAAQSVNAAGRYSQQQISAARQQADKLGMPFDDVLQNSAVAGQLAGAVTQDDLRDFHPSTLEALQGKTRYAAKEDLPLFNRIALGLHHLSFPNLLANALIPDGSPDAPTATIANASPQPQMWQTRQSVAQRLGIRLDEGLQQLGDSMAGAFLGMVEGYSTKLRKDVESMRSYQRNYQDGQNEPAYLAGSTTPDGMLETGNIDLNNRPRVKNADGSISTVRSMSFNDGNGEVLVPTVSDDGRIMTDEEAIAQYHETGKHLGKFDTPDNATAYAENLHTAQERQYVNTESGGNGSDSARPDPVLDFLEGLSKTYRSNMESAAAKVPAKLEPAPTAVQRYTEDVVGMAPQIAAQVLAFMGAGPAAGTLFMGAQIAGDSYMEQTEKGIDPDTAMIAAFANAVGQAPLERIGFEKALAVFKTSGVWNTLKAVGGSAITEGVTEWLQKYPEAISEIWATSTQHGEGFEEGFKEFADNFGEITMQGIYEGLVAMPYGALFGGLGMAQHGRPQNTGPNISPEMAAFFSQELGQAKVMLQRQMLTHALSSAAENIDNMTTTSQGPKAMSEMLDEILPEHLKQTWIGADDAVTLYQHASEQGEAAAQTVLDTLGTDAAGLQQAAEQGTPLPVATANVLAAMQGDLRGKAMEALRATPDGVSGAEAAAYDPAARTEAAMRRVLGDADADTQEASAGSVAVLAEARSAQRIRADVNKEVTRITQQIEAAGFPRHAAQTYAQINAQQALAFQAAYSVDPVELLRRRTFTREDYSTSQGEQLFQPAYHGSPYKFDKFTLDHIGTGEGNQAFGWGLYFAGSKNVAEFYRETLSKDKLDENPEIKLKLKSALQDVDYLGFDNFAQAVSAISTHSDWATRWEVTPHEAENINALLKTYREAREGQLYKVDIPEDDVMLHWDKPLSEQPEMASAIRKLLMSGEVEQRALDDFGVESREELADMLLDPENTGSDIYGSLSDVFRTDKGASEALNSAGIKGIKYLDGTSRNAGEGSHNYVLFDDAAINILQTYYQKQGKNPQGAVTLSRNAAPVSIFKDANLSTIPHESAHIFLDDLVNVAADDGSIALAGLNNAIEMTMRGEKIELRTEIKNKIAELSSIPPADRPAALHALALELRAQAKEARTASAEHEKQGNELKSQLTEQQQADNTGPPASWQEAKMQAYSLTSRAAALGRVERAVKNALRHLQGLDQARTDLHTLRQWAGVPLEGDLAPGTEDYTKLHEATAQGFEQYLMEGKAPSRQLEGVFSRLRAWLLDVYKSARDALGLPISDDVRRVFDRMLATKSQMKQTKQLEHVFAAERDFAQEHASSYEAWQDLEELLSHAEREVQAAMDRSTLRNRNRRFKDHYAFALESLEASPFWSMVDDISRRSRTAEGHSSGGLTRESVAHYIGAEMAAELSKARPGIINAQGGGLPVDIAAKEYGYDDADGFIHEIYDSLVARGESKKSLAKSLAEQQMAQEDDMSEEEAAAMGSDGYAEYLDRMDEEILRQAAQKGFRTQEEQDRFVRNSITPRVRVQAQAAHILGNTRLRDITPKRYQAMLDKALRDRSKALVDGDVMAAVHAVDNARVANELLWNSHNQLRRADDLLKLAAETAAAKPGTYPTVHKEAMRKLLNQYDMGNMRGLPDVEYRLSSLESLVQQTLPADVVDVLPSFAAWVLRGIDPNTGQHLQTGRQSWRDLTPSQLQDVEDLLKYLRKTGYDARTDAKNSEAAKIKLQVNQAVTAMQTVPDISLAPADSVRRKAQDKSRGIYAAIEALRWQFKKADGFVNFLGDGEAGTMETLHDKMLKGEQKVRTRIDDISTIMAPHLVHLFESVKQWETKYGTNLMVKDAQGNVVQLPPSLQKAYGRKSWTADMVLAVALNCGNASNMARLTSGYELKYEMLAPLLGDQMAARIMGAGQQFAMRAQGNRPGLLSLADWHAVQGIWDAIATQWADTQATHERMYGFRPQGVEAVPITLTDPQTGHAVELRGGYYPVRYDPNVSDKVAAWGEQEDILARNESMFAVPTAKRSHTQARTEQAPGLPLRLDTGIIMEHIQDAVRFIELGEIVRQADRVTQNPLFKSEYERAYGKQDYDAIRPNLRGLVRKEPPPKSDMVVSLANSMRKYLVPWGLSWNLKVAALQMTAIFPAMGDIGAKHVLGGMTYMTTHGMTALRQIWDASPYMRSRMDNIDQDLQRNVANFSPSKREKSITIAGKEISWEGIVNAGMWPIGAVDAAATGAVWMGAYNKKLSQLQSEKVKYGLNTDSEFHQQAVDYADNMVKQSNPDFDPSSRSGFLRAQNSYRLINNFASAITLFAARHRYVYTARAKGKISFGQLARFEAYETLLPAAAMFLFFALARGYFTGDDDDDKELAKLAVSTFTDQTTMRFPMFGNVVGDGLLALMGMDEGGQRAGGIRTALDEPAKQFANITGKGGRAAWNGVETDEQAKALIYAAGDIASFIARVPVSKLIRAGERGYNQWDRGEGTPLSIIMPRPGK